MSTWTSKARALLVLGGLAALAGCDPSMFGMAAASMSVDDGRVVVAGPPGFCVDQGASHAGPNGAFVLFGSCASISGNKDAGQPKIRAVLTAAVSAGSHGPTVRGSEKKLVAFFHTPAGRQVLSRSGKADTVQVLGTSTEDGVIFLHARDSSPFPGQSVTPGYWRALFDLNGHIVTLSVIGVPQAPFSDRAGLATLGRFVAQVRAASPKPSALAPAQPAPKPAN